MTVVGARPQFVKAAALSPALARAGGIRESLLHTGQHFDANMSDVFFDEMSIPAPRWNLGIGGGTHGQNTGRMIEAIEKVLLESRPDAVVVFGDTDSTLAAAIATSKLGIALAHVEAGLRSHRRAMPEEINRVLTDHVADVLYVPSQSAMANLEAEGIPVGKLVHVGDVMFDVVLRYTADARARSTILRRLDLRSGEYHLMTLHRKENTDDPGAMSRILEGIASSPRPIVLPLHPRTARRLQEHGLVLPPVVRVTEPTGYLDTLCLESNARMILTDSGGVQKEAYFHRVPCITLRDETEWVELADCGANHVVGTDADRIRGILQDEPKFAADPGLYGNGDAADRIAADLSARLGR